jgi:Protein O-mannosyl-transferase TMEM260-like
MNDPRQRVYDGRGRASRTPWIALGLALFFLSAHLPFLASDLDDIDPINFALGVRHFDPTLHRPHPPGYPVFVGLAKLTTWAFRALGGSGARPPEVAALALLSALSGAIACFFMVQLFGRLASRGIGRPPPPSDTDPCARWVAVGAALTAATCPLYWFTGSRPLSDLPGLAMALLAQTLVADAFLAEQRVARGETAGSPGLPDSARPSEPVRLVVAGAFAAAIAIGFRSQTAWLTLPLLGLALADRVGRGAARALARSAAAFAAGVFLWGVPLILASGGLARYLRALTGQGAEDFAGVDMWFTNPTPRRLAFGLYRTFVLPWALTPVAAVVLALAFIGLVGLLFRSRRALLAVLAAAGPYAIFHLLFQESVTTRYALPLVPMTAFLAMCGIWSLVDAALLPWRIAARGSERSLLAWETTARRASVGLVATALVATGLASAMPAVVAYARTGSPIFRAIEEMRKGASGLSAPPTLAMHRRVMNESRRAFTWAAEDRPFRSRTLPATPSHEALEVVKLWRDGGVEPVWFLADPSRTDLALIDPAARRRVVRYRWAFGRTETYVGGARPWEMDWYDIRSPGWFVGEGWSLTPETAGTAARDRKGPGLAPIDGWVRRRGGPATLMLGGRNLGGPTDPRARILVTLDGREIDHLGVAPAPGFFLRVLSLPAGVLLGPGPYARLRVSASADDGAQGPVNVGIEQFDVQDEDQPVFGYDAGWHELEYDAKQGRLWRWTSNAATLRVHAGAGDRVLVVSGESPMKYFRVVPVVTVRAGTVMLGRFEPSADYTFRAPLPAAALQQAGGLVTIETSQSFVPDERTHNGDRRCLGLRVWTAALEPATR